MDHSTNWSEITGIFTECVEINDPLERDALLDTRCEGRPRLRAQVESLVAGWLQSASLDHVQALPSAVKSIQQGERIGPYRILSELGRGGMGVVYRAERADGQFERVVAIKMMAVAGLMTSDSLRRFETERRILGALEHPNISRLFDAGCTASGIPYLVMEYVEGVPITDYSEQRGLSTRQRVTLFQLVCRAVQFAHQRLVIHRDLKPGNILVDAEGQPKLLDFGISRLLDADLRDESTVTGMQRLTLNFASPEQIRGDIVTTSSDVYSLGVVLYRLLAGVNPYDFSGAGLAEAIRRSQEIAWKPLRGAGDPVVTDTVDADLEAVVRKAMMHDAAERYASPQNLAEDLERYLNGQPVSAQTPSFFYIARKFVRRRWKNVAVAAAATLLLTVTTAAALWQGRVALGERAQAEKRSQELRKLTNSLLFDFQKDLARLQGTLSVRKSMIQKSMEYLDGLSRQSLNPDLRRELASGYMLLGDVEGGVDWSLGDRAAAMISYRKANQLIHQVLRENPNHPKATFEVVGMLFKMTQLTRTIGLEDEYHTLNRELATRVEALHASFPNNPMVTQQYARQLFDRAYQEEDREKKNALLRMSLEAYEHVLRQNPDERSAQYNVALLCKRFGASLAIAGRPEEARTYIERAERMDRGTAQRYPNDAGAQLDWTYSLSTLASLESKRNNHTEAVKLFREMVAVRRRLWLAEPKNARLSGSYASALATLAEEALKLGLYQEAGQAARESITVLTETKQPNKSNEIVRAQSKRVLSKLRDEPSTPGVGASRTK